MAKNCFFVNDCLVSFAVVMYNHHILTVSQSKGWEWMTAQDAGVLWGITTRRVQFLCTKDKVKGAQKLGNI